jgi:ABC-type glycerol-3-phosphate transport system substrate-binding protein
MLIIVLFFGPRYLWVPELYNRPLKGVRWVVYLDTPNCPLIEDLPPSIFSVLTRWAKYYGDYYLVSIPWWYYVSRPSVNPKIL